MTATQYEPQFVSWEDATRYLRNVANSHVPKSVNWIDGDDLIQEALIELLHFPSSTSSGIMISRALFRTIALRRVISYLRNKRILDHRHSNGQVTRAILQPALLGDFDAIDYSPIDRESKIELQNFIESLTDREREVCLLTMIGLSTAEIAKKFQLRQNTITATLWRIRKRGRCPTCDGFLSQNTTRSPTYCKGCYVNVEDSQQVPSIPQRTRLPNERAGPTHSFRIGEHQFSITCGLSPESGQLLEVFLSGEKVGTTISGLLDSIAITVSYSLQYGVSLGEITDKLIGVRFEPSGRTSNKAIPFTTSPVDYVGRWLLSRFGNSVAR